MQPTFGSELHRFVFEAQTDDGLADVRGTIEDSVKTWMPFVTIDDVLIDRQTDFNRIIVRIYFSVTTMVGLTGNVSLVF
jgi:phage baseplate assembly protein W